MLQLFPAISCLSRIGFHGKSLRSEPFCNLVRVADGKGVDDPVAGQFGNLLCEPSQAL